MRGVTEMQFMRMMHWELCDKMNNIMEWKSEGIYDKDSMNLLRMKQ